ncbi:MAG: hypothetical protein UY95_C0015G0019 [Parcubacteria group bacterium GW2011_GWA2_56_7]|nr:MAG: hypothetical protein UY95_C0015G0019 [Parcubacteria group bacterium GW2011_GWA2_56_7]
MLRFGRENDTGDDFFVETPVSLAGAVEGNPIVFHEPIGSLSFVRSTTLEKVGRNLGTQYVDNLQVFGCVSISYRDLNGNKINVIYNQDTATGAIRETIAVSTTWNFADRPELQPLDLDLRPIGYGVIEGAFYVKPLVHIGDQSGYAYFSTDGSSAMAKELMVERGEAIRTGIQEALSLFGLPEDNITGVTIMDRGFSNAYADARTQSVIYFTDEILEGPGQMGLLEQMIKGGELTEEAVASVAAHEVFHQIDHLYDISRDERVRSLFRRLSKADLFRVNEKRDGKLYGGHAQDDQMELFASFMNTIRGDNWERRRAWMTFEDVLVYEEIVGVILERLEDIPELGDAPVRDVLRARQEELNQRIRARE